MVSSEALLKYIVAEYAPHILDYTVFKYNDNSFEEIPTCAVRLIYDNCDYRNMVDHLVRFLRKSAMDKSTCCTRMEYYDSSDDHHFDFLIFLY